MPRFSLRTLTRRDRDGSEVRLLVDDDAESSDGDEGICETETVSTESCDAFLKRHYKNVIHFLVEDWFLSGMLGIITALLSVFMDVTIEYINHYRVSVYYSLVQVHEYYAFGVWILLMTVLVFGASLFCHGVSKQAVGSGIPEVKVIIHGFMLKNYLTLKTLIAKIVGLTLTLGAGMPVGKEGPFVHIGAIVASLLSKTTAACRYNNFFSNEGRVMEMLSTGCAVGIACTFSAPVGAVLYGIESTSKYFAVKNYWKQFFATTCAALAFRFIISFLVPTHVAGTILAYLQTNFPNEVFLIEEIPFFILMGILCGLAGGSFVWLHRRICMFKKKNKVYQSLFGKSPITITALMAALFAVVTYPAGIGRYIAGPLTFRQTLSDFLSNCTYTAVNGSGQACPQELLSHWVGQGDEFYPLMTLSCYLVVYFVCIAVYITLYYPSGIFVPSFVLGACGGRLMGEIISLCWPEGFRGPDGPQIYPGLYAVVGAAAYTGAVTHSLSIALIVCETTGQLCALFPVLIALMIATALCSFLQPSIYESTIKIQNYPYLIDLPPSRVSVHTMKVDKVMVKDIVFITRDTTYQELRDILIQTPNLRSYPYVNDKRSMILLGSVGRKFLLYLLNKKLGPEPCLHLSGSRSTASEIFNTIGSMGSFRSRGSSADMVFGGQDFLTDRQISGNTLLAHSPLHDVQGQTANVAPILMAQAEQNYEPVHSLSNRAELLSSRLDVDELAVDSAPFQLVKGTSLYKVHTLFSLLALNHAYVTERGRLVGVVALKELREALHDIYTRGAVPISHRQRATTQLSMELPPDLERERDTRLRIHSSSNLSASSYWYLPEVTTVYEPELYGFSDLPFPNLAGNDLLDYLSNKQNSFKVMDYGWDKKQQETRGMPATADQPRKFDPRPNLDYITLDKIPDYFDSRDQWPQCSSIKQIFDQSQCGCCYAFCTTEIMADRLCIHANKQVQMSVLDVISCCPDCGGGCGGGNSMNTLQHWVTDGFVTGGENTNYQGCQNYPFPPCSAHGYKECPCSGYATPQCNQTCQTGYSKSYVQDKTFGRSAYLISGDVIDQSTVIAIQREILANGPVKATFDMYSDFYPYVSGVYVHTAGTSHSRHCVKIIGWGTENGTPYWLIANSFGPFWGEQGFVKFLRGVNECGIEAAVGAALPAV